jgi:hypothetical protein
MFSTFALFAVSLTFAADLAINTDFPGGSAQVESLDQTARSIVIRPTPHKDAGWECWWNFQLSGILPDEELTLTVRGMGFALASRASFSLDEGRTWQHTSPGKVEKDRVTYRLKFPREKVRLAWGPPFQLAEAEALIKQTVEKNIGAKAFELARSKGDHPVPALRWDPPAKAGKKRPGIWIQARQHAWESGASWVGAGFVDWLRSDDAAAKSLRENARIVYVPIMDVDNVELGAGGKNQKPHDHNRDWSDEPVFNAVRAAQRGITEMDEAGEMNLFIDLHNPGPGDLKPFFFVSPADLLSPEKTEKQKQWLAAAKEFLGPEKLGLADKTKESGASYHPLWRQISKNWVTHNTQQPVVAVTLETAWNTPNSTQTGYQSYGRALGRAVHAFLLR